MNRFTDRLSDARRMAAWRSGLVQGPRREASCEEMRALELAMVRPRRDLRASAAWGQGRRVDQVRFSLAVVVGCCAVGVAGVLGFFVGEVVAYLMR